MIDKRVFITVLVCLGIMLFWNLVVAPPKKPVPPTAQSASQPATKAPLANVPASSPAVAAAAAASQPVAPALPEQKEAIDTPLMHVELSSYGAAITHVTLKEYKEGGKRRGEQKHPVSLLGEPAGERVDGASVLLGGAPMIFSSMSKSERGVDFQYKQGSLEGHARWAFAEHDYLLALDVELKNTGASETTVSPALKLAGLFDEKTLKDKSMFEPPPDLIAPAAYIDGQLYKHAHGENDDPPTGRPLAWAGIDKQYFLLAAAPEQTPIVGADFDEQRARTGSSFVSMSATLTAPETKLAPGQTLTQHFKVYAGPKASAFLKRPNKELEEAIDYKVWFMPLGFLSRPMLWILNQAYGIFHSYGIAILILTLIVKLLLLPVTQKSFMSMQVMRDLKPDLDKIKARFPDDREKQGLETMRLYKERGVNPFLSGCLPALLQMPVYFALWRTLWAAVELYQQEFLWLGDLTAKDPFYILPLLLGGVMFVQQKLSPPAGDPQQQKIMLYMMPPLMTLFMVGLPSGLVFYIFVNTILTILQQAYINRKFGKKTALTPAT